MIKKVFLLILLSSCVKTYKVQTELVNQPKIKFKTEFTKLELDQVNFQKQNNNYYLTEEEMTKLTNNILKFKTYIEYIKEVYNTDINAYQEVLNGKENV